MFYNLLTENAYRLIWLLPPFDLLNASQNVHYTALTSSSLPSPYLHEKDYANVGLYGR